MAVRKPVAAPPSNIEIGNLFEQELEAQNEDLRRKAALGTLAARFGPVWTKPGRRPINYGCFDSAYHRLPPYFDT